MATMADLRDLLRRIDGRGYRAYKDLAGMYTLGTCALYVDHVQGDPFAAPSKIRVRIPMTQAGLPPAFWDGRVRRLATEDFLARQVRQGIGKSTQRGSGKSGRIEIDAGGQQILERTSIKLTAEFVEARLQVGLPARGRTVLGRQAADMLLHQIPELVERTLYWSSLPQQRCQEFVECVENQEHLRDQLVQRDLVAFIANGSVLPRESGACDRPLRQAAVPFRSPQNLEVQLDLLHPVKGETRIGGLGIPRGVTLIVGGGYHGKSTVLKALERCVYPHIPGDGREYVVTARDAVKIRAEDGRRVANVDIGAFIENLPAGRDTASFCSDDASGSTSQAANIIEALEIGARGLLLDEDTSATNFMVRDGRMQALVHKEHEPITPFLDRVGELWKTVGVSTVLVMGGCGDYFEVADRVILMRDFLPYDATADAAEIAARLPSRRRAEAVSPMGDPTSRIPLATSFDPSRGRREVKIDTRHRHLITFGTNDIDLLAVEQLVDTSQTRAIGCAIYLALSRFIDGNRSLTEVLALLEDLFDREGLDPLDPFHRKDRHPGNFARPRSFEIAAAINRLRTVRFRRHD